VHPYIPHLLSDIKAAHRLEQAAETSFSQSFEEEMEEIERYISGDGEQPLSYFTGLKKETFPPAELLNEKDMEAVLNSFDEMLETWNIIIDYPEAMPVKERYCFLIWHVLENEVTPVSFGNVHFDFCTGYAPDCAWGQYCSCLEYWNQEEENVQ
jgi:hypothetical protein